MCNLRFTNRKHSQLFLEHLTTTEAIEWKCHQGSQFKLFLAILKMTPYSLFIDGIQEDLLTKNVVRKQNSFNLFFPQIIKKQFKKEKSPQIDAYPKKVP